MALQDILDELDLLKAKVETEINAAAASASPAATVPEPEPSTLQTEPALAEQEPPVEQPAGAETPLEANPAIDQDSVDVPVKASSVVPSASPVNEPNTTTLEEIRGVFVQEIQAILNSPLIQQDLSIVETKAGQFLIGLIGTLTLTTGSIIGGFGSSSLAILTILLGGNLAHLVLNAVIGAFKKR